jgi:hypothetical protein
MYVSGMSLIALCSTVSIYNLVKCRQYKINSSESKYLDDFLKGILLWILFLAPVLMFTFISLTIHQIYVPWRYLIIVLPGFILLMTQAFFLIPWRWIRIPCITLLVSLSLISVFRNSNVSTKIGLKTIAEYIQKNAQPDDVIGFIPGYNQEPFHYYFRGKIHTLEDMKGKDWFDNLQIAAKSGHRLWLVVDWSDSVNNTQAIKFIKGIYGEPVQSENLTNAGVDIYLFIVTNQAH